MPEEHAQPSFTQDLVRHLARREARTQKLGTLTQAKQFLRNARERFSKEPAVISLTRELMTPNTKVVRLVEEVQRRLTEKYQVPGLGIVLLGSSAHGGGEIGYLAQREDTPDLDYSLISSDKEGLERDGEKIREFITAEVERLRVAYKLTDKFEVCKALDGDLSVENITSPDQAKVYLSDSVLSSGEVSEAFFLYFYPTIPAELNERNQQHIATALKEIYQEDPDKWLKLKGILLKNWQMRGSHIIKQVHLGDDHTYGDLRLKRRIVRKSKSAMMKPFEEFIDGGR